ncbi:KpsF/GutQ family sugar-phosphate isomerase [Aureliella helgolandensis]|uniref:Arabinose 5-phosphate isomerase KdsD n=1 Tax=Aureliella helgolandensis TaxID=2527968 RepID=A0A518G0T6_9BACT|nr:KpsF/GutQ family sugar-phosphate isomerase [Aureliella helgolandensis]QDV22134.1 Arabinose 5-phosphate isomerase KdsD [Aureliella helgolandensis]
MTSTDLAEIRSGMMGMAQKQPEIEVQSPFNITIARGRQILQSEISVLRSVSQGLNDSFARGVELILACRGSVVVCGMGKAGLVGQKLAASLSSTGTPSHFLHPAEALHGDLGSVLPNDVALLLSYSGETEEITRLLPTLGQLTAGSIAITAHASSTLAQAVDVPILLGKHREACALDLAPSSSTTSMMAVGDALALVASEQRGFTRDQFAKFHPAGSLGRRLARIDEIMRPLSDCRLALDSLSVREVMIQVSRPGRRTGAIMLTNDDGQLTGMFTDSDLAKLLERSGYTPLEQCIQDVMTRQVQTISPNARVADAAALLASQKISELPVLGPDRTPLGIVDVTDLLAEFANATPSEDITRELSPTPTESPRILPISNGITSDPKGKHHRGQQ